MSIEESKVLTWFVTDSIKLMDKIYGQYRSISHAWKRGCPYGKNRGYQLDQYSASQNHDVQQGHVIKGQKFANSRRKCFSWVGATFQI